MNIGTIVLSLSTKILNVEKIPVYVYNIRLKEELEYGYNDRSDTKMAE